jgi:hypothetical protein
MRARHLLSVSCARAVDVRLQMPYLCTPMIGRKTREPQGLQQGLQLQQNRILTTPKAIREDCTRVGIDQRGVQSCRCVHWLRAPEATPQYTMRAAADRPRAVPASMPSHRTAHRAGHKRLAMIAMGFCGTTAAGHAGAPGATAVPGSAR